MNKVLHGDCLELMGNIPDKSIDMVLTSPPYDNLRTYEGSLEWGEHIWKPVFQELFRIIKDGGVVVWVVGDATIKGSETGTSFKQALYAKECGFNLHDTMIWIKEQLAFPDKNRYYGAFEYMFVFSKGKPETINLIKDKKNVSFGRIVDNSGERKKDGTVTKKRACAGNAIKKNGVRWNWWLIHNQARGLFSKHPAVFPEQLANDHILSWSNENDIVLDPFAGSGTTAIAAIKTGRKYILMEKEKKYIDIINKRIEDELKQGVLFK
jgi:DNA modification methylase